MNDEVVVVILNWNAEQDTAACVESFLAQHDVRATILLVDNASSDGSADRLRARFPTLHFLQVGANLGYCGGNNRGLAWALARGAEWVLVVNNDTVAAPDCVRLLLDAARRDPRLAAVGPLIVRHDDPGRVWFAGGRFDRARAIGVHRGEAAPVAAVLAGQGSHDAECRRVSFLTGCCLLLRTAAVRDVGSFPESYFAYGEDVEFCLRLRDAGWQLGWVAGAVLAHKVPPPGWPPTPAQILLRDRNRRRLVRTHYDRWWRIIFALWFYPSRMMHLARYLLARDHPRARAILAGLRER